MRENNSFSRIVFLETNYSKTRINKNISGKYEWSLSQSSTKRKSKGCASEINKTIPDKKVWNVRKMGG